MIQSRLLKQFPNVVHGFSVSGDGLPGRGNMSLNTGLRDEVLLCRRRFCESLKVRPEDIVMADQVHGAQVFAVGRADKGKGAQTLSSPLGEGDALCTNQPGVPLTILVADCACAYFFDPEHKAIGLAHAGWRGAAQGIVRQLVATMAAQYGSRPERLHVWVSPAIGVCCFEVGPEVLDTFRQNWPNLKERTDWFHAGQPGVNRWKLDLKALVQDQLLQQGIPAGQIEVSPDCTCCQTRYFSYRRSGKGAGHMMGLLALRDEG